MDCEEGKGDAVSGSYYAALYISHTNVYLDDETMGGTIANGGSMALKGMPTLAFNSSLNNTNLFANSEANSTGGYFDNAGGELYASANGENGGWYYQNQIPPYVGDKKSKSYHSYYRSYDARLTRWKSTDPVIQPWQSPYTAYNNNPIRYVDPLGNVALCALQRT